MIKKIDTSYISPLDQFLAEFDEKNPRKSVSQKKEIKKYERVYRLRDNARAEDESKTNLWEEF